jgi:tRNA A37 threonylcarbamoyltransferase TsaD
VTVSSAAVVALQGAAARGYQGAALNTAGDGNTFVTIAQDPGVIAALAGGSNVATSVAQMVPTGTLASHARLAHVRYFPPDLPRSWK